MLRVGLGIEVEPYLYRGGKIRIRHLFTNSASMKKVEGCI